MSEVIDNPGRHRFAAHDPKLKSFADPRCYPCVTETSSWGFVLMVWKTTQ